MYREGGKGRERKGKERKGKERKGKEDETVVRRWCTGVSIEFGIDRWRALRWAKVHGEDRVMREL